MKKDDSHISTVEQVFIVLGRELAAARLRREKRHLCAVGLRHASRFNGF